MEKDRKEFQIKMAGILAESIGNEARLETEKVVFISNIKNGSHLYIDPLVDTVKKTLKQKNSHQTKFNALMVKQQISQLLKEAMDTRNKELAKYVTTKILDRLKAIAKSSIKPDKNKLFTPQVPGDDFYLLLLECLFNWSIFFQLPSDQKMQPSAFKIACSELQQAGIRFPTQFKYFTIAEPQQQIKKEQKIKVEKKQEKKQPQPQINQSTPADNIKKAEETFKATKSFLSLFVDILRENEDISYVLDLTPSLKDLTVPISEQISELSADDDPRAEQLVGDLIRLGEFLNDLIKDLNDCTRKKMQLAVFKKKYHPQIEGFLNSLQYQESNVQKVEEPKTTFQEEVVQASKQVIENDNPFVFNQVANFDQQEIEKTQQELQKQKIIHQEPQVSAPPPIIQEQKKNEKEQSQMAFGFDQFTQQVNQNQPVFDTQWAGTTSAQPAEQIQPFGLPENEKQIDLPFDQKGSDREQFHSQWEITNNQPQSETEWNPGWNTWQGDKENQMNEEVTEKTKPTLPQDIKKQNKQEIEQPQEQRKKKNNPFERQPSSQETNPWNENNQEQVDTGKSKDDFAGFSKIMDNKSDYKTDMDSKPFSNVFGFGDDLGDLNLENMAGSSKMSKQDRSKSFESEQGKTVPNQFFQANTNQEKAQQNSLEFQATNEWSVKNPVQKENQFQSFPFAYKENEEQRDDFVDPYQQSDPVEWKFDEFAQKPTKNLNVDQNLSNINKDDERSENQDSPNPFKDSNDFKFDLNKLPKHSLHVMSQRQLQYCQIKGVQIASTNRKIDAEVQVNEQQTTILKYNPQQEVNHQKEKQILIKELQELRYLKNEYEQDILDQKKLIENYEKQFKQFKQFEIRMTDAYKQLNKQFSDLNEHYKQQKENLIMQAEEINKISIENAQLNEQFTQSIKELSDSKSNEESLLNRLRIIEKQFQSIRMDHKCPMQQYLLQYIKFPNLIETEMPTRLSLIQNCQQDKQKSQNIMVKYDPCLFMDILRGCVQPFSNDINDLKYSQLLPRAILYEDSIIQIGVITKQLSEDLSVQLHIKNKSDQNLVIKKINLIAPSNNQLNKFNVQDDSVLQRRTTFKISLKFQYQEFMKQPILEFTANNQEYHILLPVSIIKFATSELIDVITIREKWKENKINKTRIKAILEQPNPKFIGSLDDFTRYFSSLVKFENKLIMEMQIDKFDFGVKFSQQSSQLIIKVQTNSLLKIKAEQLLQHFLFLFNL